MLPAQQNSIISIIKANAARFANRPALIDGGITINWRELEIRTDRLARSLAQQGLGPGDRLALVLLDGGPAIELLLAAGKIGAIAVPLNWRLATTELAWIIGNAAPMAIYASSGLVAILPELDGMPCHVLNDAYDTASEYHAIASGGAVSADLPRVEPTSPLYMLYTSGTTGRPKGCLHSHRGTWAAATDFAQRRGLRGTDCLLSTNPLFHISGLGQALAVLAVGGSVCFAPRDADGDELLRLAVEHQCTFASLIDGKITGLRRAHQRLGGDIRFRTMTISAGVLPPEKFGWLEREWNCVGVGGWGQTEAGGFALQIDYADMLARPAAMGAAMAHYDYAVLGEDGHPLEPDSCGNVTGELGLRGDAVTLGYWRDSEATAAALGTGWLRTGDLVRRDAQGLFTMLGRTKELIKSGGENVYPAEVEKVLLLHPAIQDAAISGVADAKWTEAVRAHIVVRAGKTISHGEIAQWCRARIAGYKRPRYIDYIDEIPRDPLGKVKRRLLMARPVTGDQAAD